MHFTYESPFNTGQTGSDVELIQEMLERPIITGCWTKADDIAYDQVMRKSAWSVMVNADFAKDFLPKGVLFI